MRVHADTTAGLKYAKTPTPKSLHAYQPTIINAKSQALQVTIACTICEVDVWILQSDVQYPAWQGDVVIAVEAKSHLQGYNGYVDF